MLQFGIDFAAGAARKMTEFVGRLPSGPLSRFLSGLLLSLILLPKLPLRQQDHLSMAAGLFNPLLGQWLT